MQQSKLVRQLRILSAPELKRLYQFLKSPFYNANPAIVKLYLLLREAHPTFDAPGLNKEKLFKKLFPGRAYEHQKMLNLMSDFTALLEQYMVVLQLEKEDLEQKKLLVRAYAERPDCYEVFEKKLSDLDRFLDAQPFRDELYFHEKKDLNLLYFEHPGTDMVADGRNALQLSLRYFETFKALTAAKMQCSWNSWENAVGARKTISPDATAFDLANPLIDLYQKLDVLQRNQETSTNLQELVDLFGKHIGAFRPDDQSNILTILLNHCNRQINKGRLEFIATSFELYKTGLEHACFTVHGKLKESIFHNIVSIATLCGEFDWAKSFMEEYQSLLDADGRASALALAMGQWHCEKEEYAAAIESLRYPFQEPQDAFKAKGLTIKAWCELFWENDSYFDLLLAQLEAAEKFVRRNQEVSSRLSEGMLKFIGFTRKIALLKYDGKKTNSLNDDILQEPNLLFKSWLLKKQSK